MLALVAIVMALAIALPLGTLAALKAGQRRSTGRVMAFAMLGFSSPVFIVAFFLVYVFALGARLVPDAGLCAARRRGCWPCLEQPRSCRELALAMLYAALLARDHAELTLLEVLAEDCMSAPLMPRA